MSMTTKGPKLSSGLGLYIWLQQMEAQCSRQLKETSVSICQLIIKHHSNIIQSETAAGPHRTLMVWLSFASSHDLVNIKWVSWNISYHQGGMLGTCCLQIFYPTLHTHFLCAAVLSQDFQLLAFLCIWQWNPSLKSLDYTRQLLWALISQLLLTSWSSSYICEIIKVYCTFWSTLQIIELSFKC